MPKLLVIGSGGAGQSKRYIMETLVAKGYRLIVLAPRLPEWITPLMLHGEPMDLEGPEAVARAVAVGHRHAVDGVFTIDEAYVEPTAQVAAGLGLPGLTGRTARWCRDKHAMRRRLAEAGVPSPRSIRVERPHEALAAADSLGYPVVLKPRSLGGSFGVVRADGPDEVQRLFPVASGADIPRFRNLSGLLVESYLDGPEFSVEAVSADGITTVCGITEKVLGFAPFFEETGHFARPVRWAEPLDAALVDVTMRVHEALGVTTGATHCELRVTADGPYVVEIAGRLGGDRIPMITELSGGVDLIGAAAAVATGEKPALDPVRSQVAGIRMVYPRHDGVITRLGLDRVPPGLVEHMGWYAAVGQSVHLPPRGFLSRLGYLVATDTTKTAVTRRLDAAEAALDITIEADGAPQAPSGA